ncbi:lipid A-modifier LpxR family protein [Adhaeribacter terreus]
MWLAFPVCSLSAQELKATTPDSVNVSHWLIISYDNDAHFKTDYYYTQGIRAEYIAPLFERRFFRKLLLKLPGTRQRTVLVLVNDAFTPQEIEPAEIQRGDRPFAGYFYAGLIQRSYKPEKDLLFTSELDLGVMGPWSGAEPFQTKLHTWLGDPLPHGWKNQIAHDMVLNYNLKLEKRLLEKKDLAGLYFTSRARAGTLYNDLNGGFVLCLGATDAFRSNNYAPAKMVGKTYQKLKPYAFLSAEEKLVLYNATLQGGVLNEKRCAYTLPAKDVERLVGKGGVGIGVTWRKFMLEYALYRTTPEFDTGLWHNYSQLKSGLRF